MLLADDSVFEDTKVFNKLRLIKREKTDNTIIFVAIFIKARYDFKHLILSLKKDDEIHLKLHYEYSISDLINRKLSQQRVDFFKILTKIDHSTYRLQLSSVMKIYSIIFVTQLEPAATIVAEALNSYKRRINIESSLVINEG